MTDRHLSMFALDRRILGATLTEPEQAHLDDCDRCQRYIEEAQLGGPVPGWVRAIEPGRPRPGRRWLWAGGTAGLVAAAAALLLVVPSPDKAASDGDTTTIKGSAAVAVHIKRDERVFLWDGQSALQPGDALRLEVVPDDHAQVTVFARQPDATYTVLYAGPLGPSAETTVLPKAWAVDDSPGPEEMVVVLSDGPLPAAVIASGPDSLPRDQLWLRRLTFRKDSKDHLP